MFKNKKGQFYIIISVIFAVAIFGITSTPNTIREAILFEDFEDLSNNYIHESEYVINYALQNKTDVETSLDNFSKKYIDYAKQRNPNIQLLYIYSNGSEISLVNHFNSTVSTTNGTNIIGAGQPLDQEILIDVGGKDFSYKVPVRSENFGKDWYSANLPNTFNLSIGGFLHPFDISGAGPDLKVIINLPEGQGNFTYPGSEEYIAMSPQHGATETFKYTTNQVMIR